MAPCSSRSCSGSVGDLLDSYLEAEPLKGFLGFLGLTSVYGGPW